MKNSLKHFKLGASIYVPATRDDILDIANEKKFASKSVIFCTEDSVRIEDLAKALLNIEKMLLSIKKSEKMMKFIRVRNEEVLKKILTFKNIENIDGFVLPKVTANNFLEYMSIIKSSKHKISDFSIMPTLETKEVFSIDEMQKLCNILLNEDFKDSILSLRIGGNDLLNILGVRRSKHRTIYESPLSVTITNLITIFKSQGFNLTSPVCEFLHDTELLNKELPLDLEFGLFGKTAVHPDQIAIIESSYMPTEQDYNMAIAILDENAPAVFKMYGTMCEPATHRKWAREIVERANIYGVYGVIDKSKK